MVEPPAVKQSNTGKLIVRLVVFGVLLAALGVAGLDYMKKSSAVSTGAAWSKAVAAAEKDGKELTIGELPAASGDPAVKSEKLGNGLQQTYTWSGLINDYEIMVTARSAKDSEDAKDAVIDGMEGVGIVSGAADAGSDADAGDSDSDSGDDDSGDDDSGDDSDADGADDTDGDSDTDADGTDADNS